jgi:hypothetical protein
MCFVYNIVVFGLFVFRELKNHGRANIFQNAVLVLSKCDKTRQGNEARIMKLIERTSSNFIKFPYE